MKARIILVWAVAGWLTGCLGTVHKTSPNDPFSERVTKSPSRAPAPRVIPSQKSGADTGGSRPAPQSPAVPPIPAARSTGVGDSARHDRDASRLVFRDANRTVLEFQARPLLPAGVPELYRRGGYIAKILTPSGRVISDDFPTKHIHHHGLWAAWTKTVFEGRQPDFWNMGEGKGRVEFQNVDVVTATRVRSRQRYVDMTIKPELAVLEETFDVQLRPSIREVRPAYVFDVILTQNCLTASPLHLPEYPYGGLGFRGNGDWDGADQCQFLTSEGISNRVQAQATKARWCHISGLVEGRRAGIAILCHPGNFRAPQPMRVHPTEPFFCYAPPAGGAFSIQPGQPYVARYRCLTFDGESDRAWIDRLWQQFAAEK